MFFKQEKHLRLGSVFLLFFDSRFSFGNSDSFGFTDFTRVNLAFCFPKIARLFSHAHKIEVKNKKSVSEVGKYVKNCAQLRKIIHFST